MTPGDVHQHGQRDNIVNYYPPSPSTPEPKPEPKPALPVVLLVGASPYDIDRERLRADREFRELQRSARRRFDPISRSAAPPSDIDDVRDVKAWILHISLHCDGDVMQFERSDGNPFPVRVGEVAERLRLADAGLRGLVLSTCWGNRYVERFAGLAETVVAWKGLLVDDVAVAFARHFYWRLSGSDTPDLRKSAMQAAMNVQNEPEAKELDVVEQLIVLGR